jgi:hypothetical protein
MDSGAELTLQIIRRVQRHSHGEARRFPDSWSFWPRGLRAGWPDARDLLTALPKPILVAPLLEPGMLGLWTDEGFDNAQRHAFAQQLANQVQYYSEKLAALNVPPDGQVRFGPAVSPSAIGVDAFLQWATEYGLSVGISLAASPDPGVAIITVRPPGGAGPPLEV